MFKKIIEFGKNVWNSECHAKIGILHKSGIVEYIFSSETVHRVQKIEGTEGREKIRNR